MTRIHAAWRQLPPWARAALTTCWQAIVGALLVCFGAVVVELVDWLSTNDPVDVIPQLRLLGVGVLTALGALVTTAQYRAVRPPAESYPDDGS